MGFSGHNLAHSRRQMMPPLPQTSSFVIPDAYTTDYHNSSRLLLHDSEDAKFHIDSTVYMRPEGRVLVWASDVQLKLLFESERLYMDGTFSTAPPNFDQVYIIHAIHHGTCKPSSSNVTNGDSIKNMSFAFIGLPMVYALLPDRKTTTYIYLFNVLFTEAKKSGKAFDPSLIMTDFEPGVAKAITLQVRLSLHLSILSMAI